MSKEEVESIKINKIVMEKASTDEHVYIFAQSHDKSFRELKKDVEDMFEKAKGSKRTENGKEVA